MEERELKKIAKAIYRVKVEQGLLVEPLMYNDEFIICSKDIVLHRYTLETLN